MPLPGHFLKALAVCALALGLSSCATQNNTISPNGGYLVNKNKAYILVGYTGTPRVAFITQKSQKTTQHHLMGGPEEELFVVPVPIGYEFKITAVGAGRAFRDQMPSATLKATEHGIYYYGTITLDGDEIRINPAPQKKFLEMLKTRHPDLATGVEPSNFLWDALL